MGGPGRGNGAEKRQEAEGNIGRALLHTRAMLALASAPRALTLATDEASWLYFNRAPSIERRALRCRAAAATPTGTPRRPVPTVTVTSQAAHPAGGLGNGADKRLAAGAKRPRAKPDHGQ